MRALCLLWNHPKRLLCRPEKTVTIKHRLRSRMARTTGTNRGYIKYDHECSNSDNKHAPEKMKQYVFYPRTSPYKALCQHVLSEYAAAWCWAVLMVRVFQPPVQLKQTCHRGRNGWQDVCHPNDAFPSYNVFTSISALICYVLKLVLLEAKREYHARNWLETSFNFCLSASSFFRRSSASLASTSMASELLK